MAPRSFSAYEIADLLGATPGAVVQWMEKGWLPCEQPHGGAARISEDGLIQFIRRQGMDVETVMARLAPAEVSREAQTSEQPEAPPAEAPRIVRAADSAAQVAEAILRDAVVRGAGYIHLESRSEGLRLRLRVDGVLHEKPNFARRLPNELGPKLIKHFKLLAGLEGGRSSLPGVGRFTRTVDGHEMEFRLAGFPIVAGERIVIRVVDREAARLGLSELGLEASDEAYLRGLLARRFGLVVLAGPPRSGKATSLRAMVGELAGAGRSIITVEKAAEAAIDGVSRARVDPAAGFTFAAAARACIDQDVDAIMIEELRDPVTASAALEAALDGRIVLAGMNATSGPAALASLLRMHLEPWPLASALAAIIEQRTVRKLCQACRRQVAPGADVLEKLGLAREQVDFPVFAAAGCESCGNCGYAGRIGLFSIMRIEGELAQAVRDGAGIESVSRAAAGAPAATLLDVGLEKARAGLTSLAELARILA